MGPDSAPPSDFLQAQEPLSALGPGGEGGQSGLLPLCVSLWNQQRCKGGIAQLPHLAPGFDLSAGSPGADLL